LYEASKDQMFPASLINVTIPSFESCYEIDGDGRFLYGLAALLFEQSAEPDIGAGFISTPRHARPEDRKLNYLCSPKELIFDSK